jgi:hypothetical protein
MPRQRTSKRDALLEEILVEEILVEEILPEEAP